MFYFLSIFSTNGIVLYAITIHSSRFLNENMLRKNDFSHYVALRPNYTDDNSDIPPSLFLIGLFQLFMCFIPLSLKYCYVLLSRIREHLFYTINYFVSQSWHYLGLSWVKQFVFFRAMQVKSQRSYWIK